MNKEEVKNYIQKYSSNYSKEQINSYLLSQGVSQQDLDRVYRDLSSKTPSQMAKGNSNSKIAYLLLLAVMVMIFFLTYSFYYSGVDFDSLSSSSNYGELSGGFNLEVSQLSLVEEVETSTLQLPIFYRGAIAINVPMDNPEQKISVTLNSGESCTLVSLETNMLVTNSGDPVSPTFINGQRGIITFVCPKVTSGETLEGIIRIPYKDMRSQEMTLISEGKFKVLAQ